jgi:hypothetical protein
LSVLLGPLRPMIRLGLGSGRFHVPMIRVRADTILVPMIRVRVRADTNNHTIEVRMIN